MQLASKRENSTGRSPWCWKTSRPLVLLACALSFGALLGSFNSIPFIYLITSMLLFVGCMIVASVFYKRAPHVALTFFMCAAFVFGFFRAASVVHTLNISIPQDAKEVILCKGAIRDKPQEKGWGLRFVLKLSDCNVKGQDFLPVKGVVSVNANYRFIRDELIAGDSVKVKLKFKNLSELEHKSYRNYLLSRGIGATATARSDVEIVSKGKDPLHFIEKGRERVWSSLHESIAQPYSGVV